MCEHQRIYTVLEKKIKLRPKIVKNKEEVSNISRNETHFDETRTNKKKYKTTKHPS